MTGSCSPRRPKRWSWLRAMLTAPLLVLAIAAAACDDDSATDGGSDAVSDALQEQSEYIDRGGAPVEELTPRLDSCANADPPVAADVDIRQTIRGTVVSTSIAEDAQGEVTILAFGEEGGAVPFAVAIPARAYGNFREPPAEVYDGKEICVGGVVQDYLGVPTIFVTLPTELVEIPQD